jgi:hypothetical protein
MDTSMVHDLARDVLSLADALRAAEARAVAAEAERDEARVNLATALAPNAADAALDDIAHACGCAQWEYPAQVARDVRAAVAERDAAVTGHAALAGAVRAEREAERGHAAVRADDASRGRHLRAAEAAVDKARHATDALISAAPPRSTVDARVVRAYLRADARSATGTHADAAALAAARTALDAALAAATTTPEESL